MPNGLTKITIIITAFITLSSISVFVYNFLKLESTGYFQSKLLVRKLIVLGIISMISGCLFFIQIMNPSALAIYH